MTLHHLPCLILLLGCTPEPMPAEPGDTSPTPGVDTEPRRILPLGDSITEGVPYTYRYPLHSMLQDADYAFDFVGSHQEGAWEYPDGWDMDHEGHSGWRTYDIADHLEEWLEGYTPDIVLIHLGTNDAGTTVFSEEGYTIEDSTQAMTSIVSQLRADNPNVQLYLAQILPIYGDASDKPMNDFVNEWNLVLADLAQSQSTADAPIVLVDMNSDFGQQDMDDGVHPSETGAVKMAEQWLAAILAGD